MICVLGSILLLFWLSAPWSVNVASAQVQMTDFKVLEGGNDGRCASVEEREEARNEIHQIVTSVIADTFQPPPQPRLLSCHRQLPIQQQLCPPLTLQLPIPP